MAKASNRVPVSSHSYPDTATRPVSDTGQSTRRDVLIAFALAVAVIATRFPVRSRRVFNWDAVNFVLAVGHYDVRLHHPHPPGYPVFVAMGRLLMFVIPDTNGALVAVAMLLSAGAVAALFWLGKTLYDRPTGLIAALYLLFSVTFWTNGAVALAYASLALFGTLVALFAWQLRGQHRNPTHIAPMNAALSIRYSLLLSLAYALGGGFRPDLLLFLAPLWIWGHWRAGWRWTITGALVAVAVIVGWAVPMIALSGGVGAYLKVLRAYTTTDVLQRYSVAENGPRALLVNIRDTATYTGYALYALALPVICALLWLLLQVVRRQNTDADARVSSLGSALFFALWIAPMFLFYTWVHIGDPGYVFTFVPALLLLAARFTTSILASMHHVTHNATSGSNAIPNGHARLRWSPFVALVAVVLVALPIAANTVIFLKRPLALTAPGIRQQDRTIDGKLAYVRAHGDPATTMLVSYESYRHWLLYLPEYRTQFVDVTYGTEADRTLSMPPGITQVILMDDTLVRTAGAVTPTDAATIEHDRVETVRAPAAPLHFAPVSSPLGAPRA